MNIQVWSDIACPLCYIGEHHLQQALKEFKEKHSVNIDYHSFELNPSAAKQSEENIYQLLAKKYGISIQDAKVNTQHIAEQGKLVGLDLHFETLIPTNTLDAHRLIHMAKEFNLCAEMREGLFKAHFTDSVNIADAQVLIQLAQEVGLDGESVQAMLKSNRYLSEVRADEEQAYQLGINCVPFFIFNDKYTVSGVQPIALFKLVLEQVQQETALNVDLKEPSNDNACCVDDTYPS